MSDQEKFEGFQQRFIDDNEKQYGKEIREKYGDDAVDESNRKILHMSQEEWTCFKNLEEEIKVRLKEGVLHGVRPDSTEAKEIVALHKTWLMKTWKQYTPKAHEGVAKMYVADERFREYYDSEVDGCAALLERAVAYWAGRNREN